MGFTMHFHEVHAFVYFNLVDYIWNKCSLPESQNWVIQAKSTYVNISKATGDTNTLP